MYIAQAFKFLHEWWRYVLGTAIAIFGVFVFSIPHATAVLFKTLNGGSLDQTKMSDPAYLMSLFEPNVNLVFILLPFAGGLIFLFITVRWVHKQTLRSLTTTRPKIDWKRFWVIFLFWGILSSGLIFLDYFMSPQDYLWNFKLQPFIILCVIAILLVPLQTGFEEYLFRGYLMQGIGVSTVHRYFPFVFLYALFGILFYYVIDYLFVFQTWEKLLYLLVVVISMLLLLNSSVLKKWTHGRGYQKIYGLLKRKSTPLIITSLVFGLLHIANPEVDKLGPVIMIFYIGTGLFLGVMTLMDEGMELSLGFHAANNLFTAVLVTADWTAFQTHSVFKDISDPEVAGLTDVIVPVFVMFPVILFILAKIYKWNNWKEKLFGKIIAPEVVASPINYEINQIGLNTTEDQ